jgi:preprotein translocase subunit Sec61beta
MRYFDTENDKGIRIGPWFVVGLALASIVIVMVLQTFVPVA